MHINSFQLFRAFFNAGAAGVDYRCCDVELAGVDVWIHGNNDAVGNAGYKSVARDERAGEYFNRNNRLIPLVVVLNYTIRHIEQDRAVPRFFPCDDLRRAEDAGAFLALAPRFVHRVFDFRDDRRFPSCGDWSE